MNNIADIVFGTAAIILAVTTAVVAIGAVALEFIETRNQLKHSK